MDRKRVGLLVAVALAAGLASAGSAQAAYNITAPLTCDMAGSAKVTNSSNYRLPKGATINVVITSGVYVQPHSQALGAALPIGASMIFGPVIILKQVGATTTCTASATWRVFWNEYVKP